MLGTTNDLVMHDASYQLDVTTDAGTSTSGTGWFWKILAANADASTTTFTISM